MYTLEAGRRQVAHTAPSTFLGCLLLLHIFDSNFNLFYECFQCKLKTRNNPKHFFCLFTYFSAQKMIGVRLLMSRFVRSVFD